MLNRLGSVCTSSVLALSVLSTLYRVSAIFKKSALWGHSAISARSSVGIIGNVCSLDWSPLSALSASLVGFLVNVATYAVYVVSTLLVMTRIVSALSVRHD